MKVYLFRGLDDPVILGVETDVEEGSTTLCYFYGEEFILGYNAFSKAKDALATVIGERNSRIEQIRRNISNLQDELLTLEETEYRIVEEP